MCALRWAFLITKVRAACRKSGLEITVNLRAEESQPWEDGYATPERLKFSGPTSRGQIGPASGHAGQSVLKSSVSVELTLIVISHLQGTSRWLATCFYTSG